MKRTPLKRYKRLNPVSKRNSMRRKRAESEAMGVLRQQVIERAGYRCEAFGCPITLETMHAHHRVYRSQGGQDAIENLVALCVEHHVPWAHNQHFESVSRGFSIPRVTAGDRSDPAQVPLTLHDGRRVFLCEDGTYWLATSAWVAS